jgi:hypothetical protein
MDNIVIMSKGGKDKIYIFRHDGKKTRVLKLGSPKTGAEAKVAYEEFLKAEAKEKARAERKNPQDRL